MPLRNCADCQRVFDALWGQTRCRPCIDAEEARLTLVRTYVREHPGVSIDEAVAATGIEGNEIRKLLRDGHLQGAGLAEDAYGCACCGRPIAMGIYCPECVAQVLKGEAEALRASAGSPAPARDRPNRMGFSVSEAPAREPRQPGRKAREHKKEPYRSFTLERRRGRS